MYAVARGKTDPDVLRLLHFVVPTPFLARSGAGTDADEIDRSMTRVMVGIAEEVFCREFPIRRENPLVDADDLRSSLAAVAAIQGLVQMDLCVAQIGQEIRSILVPRCPDRSLEVVQLCHGNERVRFAIEHAVIQRLVERDTLQLAVGRVRPAMIWTGKE